MKSLIKQYLADKLPPNELEKVSRSFEIVGDIAIIKIPPTLESRKELIAEAVMEANNNVDTVLNRKGPITGVFRLRNLEHVLGEKSSRLIWRRPIFLPGSPMSGCGWGSLLDGGRSLSTCSRALAASP